jgi:exopolysaccharide production protein ExoQ
LGVFGSSIFISAYTLKSLTISIITAVHLLFAVSVYHLLTLSNVRNFRPFVTFLGAGLITLAALTFSRFVFPPPASTVLGGVIEWHAALPGFISVRHFGSWTGAVTAGFLATLLYYDDKERLSSAHALYFLSAAMTIWSGTRAAIAAIAITALILVLMRRKIPSFRAMSIIAMLTGAAMTAAWLLLPYNEPNFRLFIPSDLGSVNTLTSGRYDLWEATFEKWSHSPLWGWGSGSMFWEVYVGWTQTQPHNAVLQFLISWGIVGAVGALWLLIRAILRTHMIAVRNESMQPLLAILYTLLLMSLVEGMLHYPRFIMLIMVAFAAILAYDHNSQKIVTNAHSLDG